jgi:hypothetical protein
MRSGVKYLEDEWPQLTTVGGEKAATLATNIATSKLFSGILGGEFDFIETAVSGKFSALRGVLRTELSKLSPNDDRVLIFVTTRRSANLLSDLINGFLGEADTALTGFKARHIVGHGSGGSGGDGGMSVSSQQQVVHDFKQGTFNILVSTAVCQEGIDVGSCSLVIRYDSASTETALIQTRGRARAKGSLLVVFIPPGADGKRERHDFLAREALMIEAVATVHRAEASLIPEHRRRGFLEADSLELLDKFCEQADADGVPTYVVKHAKSQSTFTKQKAWMAQVVMPAGCDAQLTTEGEPRKTWPEAKASAAYIVLVQLLNIGVLHHDYIGTAWLMLVRQGDADAQQHQQQEDSPAIRAGPNPVSVLYERLPLNVTLKETERGGPSGEPQFTFEATRTSDGAVLGTGRASSIKEAKKVAAAEAMGFLDSESLEQKRAKAADEDEQQRVAAQGSAERNSPPSVGDTDATTAGGVTPLPKQAKVMSKSAVSILNEQGVLISIDFQAEMSGPPHQPTFTVNAVMGGRVIGTGQATTKKDAKEIAATASLGFLELT